MSTVYSLLSKCLTELCKLYRYRPVTKLRALNVCYCSKVYQKYLVNTVDFYSFLLQFIKQSVHRMIRNNTNIVWFVHQPLNTFRGICLNSPSSLVNQTLKYWMPNWHILNSILKRKVDDPGPKVKYLKNPRWNMNAPAATKFKMTILVHLYRGQGHKVIDFSF